MNLFLMPASDELFSHPLRWVGKHFVFYAAASLVAGAMFVAGAGLYSYFVPKPAEAPPVRWIPVEPINNTSHSPKADSDAIAAIDIPFKYILGATIVDYKKTHLGTIKEISVTPNGLTTVTIEKPNGVAVKAPADAFSWAKVKDTKIEAVVKPSVDYKTLFGG